MIKNILLAEYFYEDKYKKIEVPWTVSNTVLLSTCPDAKLGENNCIASGEQGFVQLMLRGELNPGWYFTITPCYRNDKLDTLHQKIFIKLELIQYGYINQNSMLEDCLEFFTDKLHISCDLEKTQDGHDILTSEGIELGSYGVRQFKGHRWYYGTGIAEPRTSIAKGEINGLSYL